MSAHWSEHNRKVFSMDSGQKYTDNFAYLVALRFVFLVDTTVQLVLGVRKPELSADIFTSGSLDHSSLNDNKTAICFLSLSAIGKIEAALNDQNMNTRFALKV